MERYEEYKPTGVEWLGSIPTSWAIKRLKHAVKHYKAGPFGSSLILGLLPNKGSCKIYSPEHLVKENVDTEYFLPDERISEMEQYLLKKDDVVIPIVGTLGRAMIYTDDMQSGIINQRLCKISPDTNVILPQFLLLLLKGWQPYQEWFFTNSRGAILDHITKESILQMPVALPSLEEQWAIVSFVQDKNAQVDQLIAQKQQMLELLREERAAIINRAVTKGLNIAAPMRESGFEWIGQVPEHWEVKRLKFISPSISVGLVINPSTYHDDNGTVPMISGKNVTENSIDISDVKYITEESNNSILPSKLKAGDIVSIRVGYPGLTAVIPEKLDGINCASVMIIRKGPEFHSPFLVMLMNSPVGMQQVDVVAYGSAQKQFNVGHAVEFVFPLPPVEEQLSIIERLGQQTDKIDATCKTIKQEIALLQEYRAALIAEAVTGQIDVRDYEPVAQEILL